MPWLAFAGRKAPKAKPQLSHLTNQIQFCQEAGYRVTKRARWSHQLKCWSCTQKEVLGAEQQQYSRHYNGAICKKRTSLVTPRLPIRMAERSFESFKWVRVTNRWFRGQDFIEVRLDSRPKMCRNLNSRKLNSGNQDSGTVENVRF